MRSEWEHEGTAPHQAPAAPQVPTHHTSDGGHPAAPTGREATQPHYHDTDCSEFLLRIYEYMDGEMGPEENLRFEAHVRECAPCLKQHEVDRTVKGLIRRVEPRAVAPAALRASIVARITTIRFGATGQ